LIHILIRLRGNLADWLDRAIQRHFPLLPDLSSGRSADEEFTTARPSQ